jgi:putative transposase
MPIGMKPGMRFEQKIRRRVRDESAFTLGTKLILDAQLFGRHGTDPAAAFLHGLREKHDLSETVFLVDQFGYRTALARLGLNGRVDYTDRNLIENCPVSS